MDGRFAVLRGIPETAALDRANDVLALSQEGRVYLARAYEAHVQDDWSRYLDATSRLHDKLVEIRDVARHWADEVMEAPIVSPNQLTLLEVAA